MEKLRIGVIGTGNMGRNHVRILSHDNRFDLIGIYDEDKGLSEKIASLYETQSYDNADELLESIDAVVIAVPSVFHKSIALKAAEYGVHTLVEKPIATNLLDAEEINRVFQNKGIKLAVGHVERFNPVYSELKKIVSKERIFYVEARRVSPFSGSGRITDVSVVEDLMIHDVDLVCDLFREQSVKSITGNGKAVNTQFWDVATCMLDFDYGYAVVNASRVSQEKERNITVHTENGCFKADLLNKTLEVSRNTNMELDLSGGSSYIQESSVQKIYIPIEEPLKAELSSFYQSVVQGSPIVVDGEMGIEALRICESFTKNTSGE